MMKKNIVAIVQARLSSSRLPGKVLINLNGKTVLQHVVDRLMKSKYINEIIIATTTKSEDQKLVDWCREKNIKCFRGDLENVLSRFYHCATENNADVIVRVTSDNPLVDPKIIDQTIELFFKENADYGANNLEKTFPHGLDVEVISYHALEVSYLEAKETFEREHVTQFIRHRPNRFKLVNFAAPGDYHEIRVTLDEEEDKNLIEKIIQETGVDVDFVALINLFKKNPELKKLNSDSKNRHQKYNQSQKII